MPDDLLDRIAQDLAAGKAVDWTAALSSMTTDAQRKQLEALRMVERIGRLETSTASRARQHGDRRSVPAVPAAGAGWHALGALTVLVEEAGSGSFGRVYRAFDPTSTRRRAQDLRRMSRTTLRERCSTRAARSPTSAT